MRPIIGITTYVEPASWMVWRDLPTALIPQAYVEAVTLAGGRAVLLPPDDLDADVIGVLDGLVLSGGADVGPELYGEQAAPQTLLRPDRDASELLLAKAALEADLPILGVCRGMQLLAVAAGGRLHQHLPDVLGHHGHRPVSGPKFGWHRVELVPGSRAQAIIGDVVTVNSFHHQGVADPGRLKATGWCPEDSLIEVVEDPDLPFALGVQWHPEDTDDFRVIAAFVEAAAKRRVSIS
jgi:putative glutamine amidotransferase